MDGVLVDSSEAHLAAWTELGRRHGIPFTKSLFERTFGMHNHQILPLWLGAVHWQQRSHALGLEKETLYRELARESVRELEGACDLCRSLAEQGFGLAVGSSGPLANVDMILNILGVSELFHALSTGDDVVHGKPHPEVFLKTAQKLGVAPATCLVIEDAPQGVEAARAAGMAVIAVTSSRCAESLSQADCVVGCLTEVSPALVESLLMEHSAR